MDDIGKKFCLFLRNLFYAFVITVFSISPYGFSQTPDLVGEWGPVMDWNLQAKHMILLPTGNVLVWSTGDNASVWNVTTDSSLTPAPYLPGDLHCAAQATMADGRIVVLGGQGNSTHQGIQVTAIYDAFTNTWTSGASMNYGRWYGSVTTLWDGKLLATSGDDANTNRVGIPELYDPETDTWTELTGADREQGLYPFMYVLPDGKIMEAGTKTRTWFIDVTGSGAWTEGPENSFGSSGYAESGCMYRPGKIMRVGGGDPAFANVAVIDMNQPDPQWREVAPMTFARRRHDVLILLDGSVLAVGGTANGDNDNSAVLAAEIWDPDTETWTTMASMAEARMYHSSAVLMTDGRVVAGGGESDGRLHAEVFKPPYLFKGPKPVINSAPEGTPYGGTFVINSPEAADIVEVAILRPSGSTHAIDYNQRYVPLTFTQSGQSLVIDAPANSFLAPPGSYLLTIKNSAGVPSDASWLKVNSDINLLPGALDGLVIDGNTSQPISGATVLYSLDTTTTAVDGSFFLEDIPAGDPIFTVSAPGYATIIVPVAITPADTSTHTFELVLPGSVIGHVTDHVTQENIAGATIHYIGGTVQTDEQGDYLIDDIASGTQIIGVSIFGYESETDTVEVPPGGTATLNFHLHEAHTAIEGEVLNAITQEPIPGAIVEYNGNTLVANEIGFYFFDNVPGGDYTVTASASGFIPQSLDVQVIEGFETTADFQLVPLSGVGGSITLQETKTGTSTTTTVSTSENVQAVSGQLYLAAVASKKYAPVNSVTGLGLVWERVKSQCGGRAQTGTDLWYALGVATESGPVTATLTGSPNNVVISVSRFSGTIGVGNVVSGNTNGLDGLCDGGSDSETYSFNLEAGEDALIFNAVSMRSASHTPGAGYSSISEVVAGNGGSTASLSVAVKAVPGAAKVTEIVDGTLSSAVDWAVVAVELIPAEQEIPPTANFSASSVTGEVPLTVNFIDESSNNPTAWLWNFGDGNTSTEQNPQHTYNTIDKFTVSLTATNQFGEHTQTKVDYITVSAPLLSCEISPTASAEMNTAVAFDATSEGGVGQHQYSWNFGDNSGDSPFSPTAQISHTYTEPGHYTVSLRVIDDQDTSHCQIAQTIHYPVSPVLPTASTTIIQNSPDNSIWNVNPDNETVTAINSSSLTVIFEQPVGKNPRSLAQAPDGTVWVVNQDDATISVLNGSDGSLIETILLPYASRPFGLAFSPDNLAAYVSLEATGTLLLLNPVTREIANELPVGPKPRGIAISSNSERIFVTRFVSPDTHGEITEVSGTSFSVVRTIQLANDPGPDAENSGRGIPNYIVSATISPDGQRLWIPSKKDNIDRGLFRDGTSLTFESTVRAIVSQVDLAGNVEVLSDRKDLNDRDMAIDVAFSPLGDYAFVASQGSNMIDVLDVYSPTTIVNILNVGRAPQSILVTDDGSRLFAHSFLSRSVSAYDVSDVIANGSSNVTLLGEVTTVSNELLSTTVLEGKQIFYNADDRRMNQDGYISCASCHLDGGSDGRVWDFADRGEGLRNTITLKGRSGISQGRVHWSANFDEIQDFENDIRGPFSGDGFMAENDFTNGTVSDPLGDPKAGLSPELDALAAYVNSLTEVPPSPHRNADGTLTADGAAGKVIFQNLQCANCHLGSDFTDSALDTLHDVGSIKPSSGDRIGQPLTGIDTPTLKGIWNTGPYLHDGSAATLEDVLVTQNQQELHGSTLSLSADDLNKLISYLKQIDEIEGASILSPAITSFSPGTGEAGEQIEILGENFTGTTRVEFNGVSASVFSVESADRILAEVPEDATTGRISIFSPSGIAVSATDFVVAVPITDPATFVTSHTGGASNSTDVSTSANVTGAVGGFYVAAITSKSYQAVTAVSGLGLTWAEVRSQCAGRSQTGVSVWAAYGDAVDGIVTATMAEAPQNAAIVVAQYINVNPVAPIGNIVSGNTVGENGTCDGGSDGNLYSFPLSTTVNNALIFGAAVMRNKTHEPGAGFTELQEFAHGSGGSAASIAIMDTTVELISAVDFNGTFSSNVDWAVVGFEILAGEPPALPDIAVTPLNHNYGDLIINNSLSQSFEVLNEGTEDLNVSSVTLSGGDAAEFSVDTNIGPFTLAPNISISVDVSFNPITPAAKSTTLRFASDDPDENPLDVPLSGNALPVPVPDIAVNPSSHDFGDIFVGASDQHLFKIYNIGSAPLEVPAPLSLIGTHPSEFDILIGSGPFTLSPGDSHEVILSVTPVSAGPKSASLRIESNDPDTNPFDVPLTATGLTPQPDIAADPASLDFGDVVVENPKTVKVRTGKEPASRNNSGQMRKEAKTGRLSLVASEAGDRQLAKKGKKPDKSEKARLMPTRTNTAKTPLSTSAQSLSVGITNDGVADLEITGISLIGPDLSQFNIDNDGSTPFILSPQDTHYVFLSFNPTSLGEKTAGLRVESDDPDENPFDISLIGNGVPAPQPDISVTPTSHDYGSVLLNEFTLAAFTVGNDGDAALNVTTTDLTGSDPLAFNIESGGGAFTLNPGETRDVVVSFTPIAEAAYSAVLQINSDDPDEGLIEAALSGIGITTPPPSPEVTFVSNQTGGSASGATVATSAAVSGDLDDLFLAAITMKPYTQITAVTGLGLTWTEIRTQCAARNQTGVSVWMAQGTPASGIVTATLASAPNNAAIVVSRYAGANPDAPIGNIVSGNTNGESGTCGSGSDGPAYSFPITASVDKAMVFGAAVMRNKTHTPGSNFTERQEFVQGGGGSAASIAVMDSTIESASTVDFNGTFSSGVDWAVVGVEILAGEPAPAPEITVTPATNAFGDLIVGGSASQTFQIRNDGNADLIVSGVSLTGADAAEFNIENGGGAVTLTPGQTHDVEVSFNPATVGAKSAALRISSNDANENPFDVALSGNGVPTPEPNIAVSPSAHDFGTGYIGSSLTQTMTIYNHGSEVLEVSGSSIAGANAAEFGFSGSSGPFSIAPGDSQEVDIVFTPAIEGAKAATWQISSNDPDTPTSDVSLSAVAETPVPDIAVVPSSHNFGTVLLNTPVSVIITIRNIGSGNLEISSSGLSGADAALFNIESGGGAVTIAPGDSNDVEISFQPTAIGDFNAELQVASNDPDQPSLSVTLEGSGADAPPPSAEVLFEESVSGGAGSGTSVSTTGNVTGVAGHLYLAAISMKPYKAVSAVNGMGLTWSLVDAQCSGRNQTGVEVWIGEGSATDGVVTATLANSSQSIAIVVTRYSGADLTNPVGNIVSGNTTGEDGACSGGSDNNAYAFTLNTDGNNSTIFGAASMRNKQHVPGGSFVEREEFRQGSGGSQASIAVFDSIITAPAAVPFAGGFSSNVDWAVIGVELKPQAVVTKLGGYEFGQNTLTVALPEHFALLQNYPNPFNPATVIPFELPEAAIVSLTVYDINGREVKRVLSDASSSPGRYQVRWNGQDNYGNKVSSGMYFYTLNAAPTESGSALFVKTVKMLLIR